jgi:hypothetical protein
MTRKSSGPDESNLELLLDTICNTFGVVLFISMLVVIRVNASQAEIESQPVDDTTELELIERQQELDEARDKLQQLRQALAQQQSVTSRYSTTESRRLAASVQKDARSLADQLDRKQNLMASLVSTQQEVNQATADLQKQASTLSQLRSATATAESQLQSEVTKRSRNVRAPELRESKRDPIPIFVKDGRLCRFYTPLQGRLSRNNSEITKSTDASGNVVYDAVPGGGLAISTAPPNPDQIKSALTGFSPQDHVLQVFFWSDSFAECQILRDVMVEMGFRHSLVPMPDNENVGASSSAGPIYEQ